MSWDIYVQDMPDNVASVEDIPADFKPAPVGKRSDIIAKIKQVVPNVDFSNPALGRIEGPDFSIEISIDDKEECDSFTFHVRGGDIAAYVIADILQNLGLHAFDSSSDTGLFKIGSDAVEGLQRWREYRDQILDDKNYT